VPDPETASPFVERAYSESYDLLVALRDYIAGPMEEEASTLDAGDRMHMIRVLSGITRQMTDIMAWLMLQKAVSSGELSPEAADSEPAASLETVFEESDVLNSKKLENMPLTVRGHVDRCRRIAALVSQLNL
jgi:regulator of CtrA degradation